AFQIVSELGTATPDGSAPDSDVSALRALTHRTIKRVTTDIDNFQFNTMIAALIEYTNELMKLRDQPVAQTPAWREAAETLALLMAPSTPFVAEEMWARLGNPFSVHQQSWPVYDEALAVEDTVQIPVQVNGKVREKLVVARTASKEDLLQAALANTRVQEQLAGKTVVREVVVPGRLVNLVVK
ncbi:MAG TPA: class I tRNA ligase family protein, partial [Thermomicrobiales bacterium]|nr:class I tRNA ligase family protein [Thermomicrobiales bacterium]